MQEVSWGGGRQRDAPRTPRKEGTKSISTEYGEWEAGEHRAGEEEERGHKLCRKSYCREAYRSFSYRIFSFPDRFHKEGCPEDVYLGFLGSAADRTPFSLFLLACGSLIGLADSRFLYWNHQACWETLGRTGKCFTDGVAEVQNLSPRGGKGCFSRIRFVCSL